MLIQILAAVAGAIAGVLATTAVAAWRPPAESLLEGPSLAELENYPIRVGQDGTVHLDMTEFVAACHYLTRHRSPRAAIDLLYLAARNMDLIRTSVPAHDALEELRRTYRRRHRRMVEPRQLLEQREYLLRQFGTITEALGETFRGLPIEFVLHDTRDPLDSIYVIRNAITGRREGGAVTSFGEDVVRAYGRRWTGPQAAYLLRQPATGQEVKATTIPLEDRTLGLVAFLCINIDIQRLGPQSRELREMARRMTDTPGGLGTQVFNIPNHTGV